jgi:hypothetical protein
MSKAVKIKIYRMTVKPVAVCGSETGLWVRWIRTH